MLVFHKECLVILAVPKTGSTAVHASLAGRADLVISAPPELRHAPLYRYNRFIRPMYEKVCGREMETVAVMREPISWLGSWYRYRQRPFLDGSPNSTRGISFDDFVTAYLEQKQPPYADVGSQFRFLEPRPNGTKISHLFRYDNQQAMVSFLEERLQCNIALPKLNVSQPADLNMSRRTENRLRSQFECDFRLYDSLD